MACGEEAFTEVAGDDLFRVADGREVDAGVPAEKYIDVCRYTLQLGEGRDSRFLTAPLARFGMTRGCRGGRSKEGFEQLGDTGGVHCASPIVDGRLANEEARNPKGLLPLTRSQDGFGW